ncbi:MAG: radical SAM protein [Planctomycetaceae bacterium]|jgi:wyosine [tRNA(Phe)-imidazoG37] synthetase (radical SAM superfamily)|nr:radical SAM protein [Planctomycetaceae bacterium]MDP7278093.1 radical SAM protein [Planctomycetaceae bacterium]
MTGLEQHRRHPRTYRDNRFVYPVLSRRSHGLSIGINLNPDKVCNFDCIYCQVDRTSQAETRFVELDTVLAELAGLVTQVSDESLWDDTSFADIPPGLRRLNDIAFSGDGEPTTFRNFDEIVEQVAALKARHGRDEVKLVLITNASMFHRPAVERGLELLDENNGEIWAKLEAGTDQYYQLIERTVVPFDRVLENIGRAARRRPLVIQSLFMRIDGQPPSEIEIDAYCSRLTEITGSGGRLKLVQVYTVARPPAEDRVTPLSEDELELIAGRVRTRCDLPTAVFGG